LHTQKSPHLFEGELPEFDQQRPWKVAQWACFTNCLCVWKGGGYLL